MDPKSDPCEQIHLKGVLGTVDPVAHILHSEVSQARLCLCIQLSKMYIHIIGMWTEIDGQSTHVHKVCSDIRSHDPCRPVGGLRLLALFHLLDQMWSFYSLQMDKNWVYTYDIFHRIYLF